MFIPNLMLSTAMLLKIYHVLVNGATNVSSKFPSIPSASAASKCNISSALKFRIPFMDMEIENEHDVHIMQEPFAQSMFVLHGNHLYKLFVSQQDKRLSLIGFLQGNAKDMKHSGAEIISWRGYLIIAVVLEDYLEIYQISEAQVAERAKIVKDSERSDKAAPNFDPIQQLTLHGRYRRAFLIDREVDRVMLMLAVNYTKLYSKIRTFEWKNTYFDLIEELTVPSLHVFSVVGNYPKYLITGKIIKHQSKTILTIHEINTTNMKLRNIQTLTVSSYIVHTVTFRSRNYIIACSSKQKICNTFQMVDGQFNLYKRRSSKELSFNRFVAGKHFLVGSRHNEIVVFTSGRLNCFASFTTNATDVGDISSILTHTNEHDEVYILLNYQRPFHTLVRMIEIQMEKSQLLGVASANGTDVEEMSTLHEHRHVFENTIGKLRSLLLQRKHAMDVFRKIGRITMTKLQSIRTRNNVNVQGGHIGVIKILGKSLRSPLQLLARINDLDKKYRPQSRLRRSPNDTNFEIKNELKVKHLKVGNLIYQGDIMDGFHLENSRDSPLTLNVHTPLITNTLNTQQLITHANMQLLYQPNISETDEITTTTAANDVVTVKIRRLKVHTINGFAWDELFDLLFLRNRDDKIMGRLILQADVQIGYLWTPLLNSLAVQQLFNLKKPQIVTSNIVISRIITTDLRAKNINGMNFEEDLVFRGSTTIVESPVKIHRARVAGDILFDDDMKLPSNDDVKVEGLKQFYTGRVIINGSLTVNNLMRENAESTRILIDGRLFSEATLKEQYLLQNDSQFFNTTLLFGNAKVIVPKLGTKYLNHYPTDQYLLHNGSTLSSNSLFVIFMSAHINGDLICKNFHSKLAELQRNVIRHGEIANVTGVKIFEAPLQIDELMALELNELLVSDLVEKSQLNDTLLRFTGIKSFTSVLVTNGAYIKNDLNASYLNNLPLDELLSYDYYMPYLHLKHKLEATNIVFHQLNGIPFDEVFTKFHVNDQDKLVLHKDLLIDGSIEFMENINVHHMVNDIDWNEYEKSLVRSNENAVIFGEKTFLYGLNISNQLRTPILNDMQLEEIFQNILSRSKAQLITGQYTFDTLHLTNVDVSVINDVPTAAFIDMRSKEVIIDGDLIMPKLFVNGSVMGVFANRPPFETLIQRLWQMPQRHWRNVVVHGNAYWNISNFEDRMRFDQLHYIYRNAVGRYGDHIITGNVHLRRPLISNMTTKSTFPKNIDLEFIAKDCLLRNTSTEQIVYGAKTFLKPLHMRSMKSNAVLSTQFLNRIDVLRLNTSLYRLSSGEPISGPLYFQTSPRIDHLVVEGLVNNHNTNAIYHRPESLLPAIKIRKIFVQNVLQIGDINGMSLDYLLENRVTKHGDALEIFGYLTFENLILSRELLLQSINGISIENLVFKKSHHMQAITGTKFIEGRLVLGGPAHVLHLNDHDLSDMYQQSIFANGNYHFDKLVLDEATFERGLVFTEAEDVPEEMARAANVSADTDRFIISKEFEKIDEMHFDRNHHLLYLDYDFDTKVLWQMPNESVARSFQYELERVSMCERKLLQVQLVSPNSIYLNNITKHIIAANAHDIDIKAENYCTNKYRKVKSKITITGKGFAKVFGMKKSIESVHIYAHDKKTGSISFALLHAIDLTTQRNEVRILQINQKQKNISDWQALTLGIGKQLRLFDYTNFSTLISADGLINNHSALSIYRFEPQLQKFKLSQIIDGDYDIIEMVAMQKNRYQLIVSCRHCQRINIYEYMPAANPPYQILQILKLSTSIDKLFAFRLSGGNEGDDTFYLLVLAENEHDYYHLYKYSHIEGWLHATYGYFHNIQMAIPLIGSHINVTDDDNQLLLLLLCGSDKCVSVKAIL